MTHRQIMEALSGLLLGMFVAILSSTVVSNALPTIVADLHGSESGYTWVVVASLLATTISTPVWGKLSDLFDKKVLVQTALVLFVIASAVAGLSQSMSMLIAMRVVQGLGAGGLTALAQVIMASMISPRERGRYSGYLGATFALGTVGGPLVGGALTQHLSWHWCFYVGVPFAVLAFVVLGRTLDLPTVEREVHIDYAGALLLAAGVSSLLIWVSLAGQQFDWMSWQTLALVAGGLVLLALTVLVESRAADPIVPLRFFREPTVVLSAIASTFVGLAMFGATVFLSQYFQSARLQSPTKSGLSTLPMILGLSLASTVAGRFITRTGRWKRWVVAGGVLLTAGLALMGTIAWDTRYVLVAVPMLLLGAGVGMMMQNLVLAVQNVVPVKDLGAASSFIAFTRTLGGAIGVSALGALLSHRILSHLQDGLDAAGIDAGAFDGNSVTDVHALPAPVRAVVQSAYGSGVADVFLAAAPFAFLALLIAVLFKETALRGAGTAQVVEPGPQGTCEPAGERLALHGRAVTGTPSTGLPGALVVLIDAAGDVAATTTSASDGAFSLSATVVGPCTLTVHAGRFGPVTVEVPGQPEEEVVVELDELTEPAEPVEGTLSR